MENKRYFLTSTNEEVHIGNTICVTEEIIKFGCKSKVSFVITLDEDNVKQLIDEGILKVEAEPEITFGLLVKNAAARLLITEDNFRSIMTILGGAYKIVVFKILLKEAALLMNPTNVEPARYYVSAADGCVHIIQDRNMTRIHREHVALFKSYEDIHKALVVLRDLHRELYPNLYGKDKKRNPS